MRASIVTLLASLGAASAAVVPRVEAANSTFYNPILPGWHSDPSCTQVNGTFYCVTSTFISFPGLPIYASNDLLNWKLISHVWNRDSQIPNTREQTAGQQEGMFAATLRYHNDHFYVACEYLGLPGGNLGVVFNSSDPYSNDAWSDPVSWRVDTIDPDLFWDDDGKLYVATHSVVLQELDLETGAVTEPKQIWGGTGGVWPEGPHIFKRDDGYYYLLIAEGGTATDHAVMMARSKDIYGPYEGYENNPVLTNRGTDQYFQTVGHADLFQDAEGNWWGVALATRGGSDWHIYPMGRETVLFPVTWEEGGWPVADPVRGEMQGWPLPATDLDVPGKGPFNNAPDEYDFNEEGAEIPQNLVYWRVPIEGNFATTDNGLRIVPSRNNVTGTPGSTATPELTGQYGLSFIGRRQTDSLFEFSVDVEQEQTQIGQEAGATIFLTQLSHIDIGVVLLSNVDIPGAGGNGSSRAIRFRTTTNGNAGPADPNIVAVPEAWGEGAIRFTLTAVDAVTYELEAGPAGDDYAEQKILVGTESAGAVSGGSGSFVGTLLGVYATCNGAGSGTECPEGGEAYFTRWRYQGVAQEIDDDVVIPFAEFNT
jgi:beta-xylosidase